MANPRKFSEKIALHNQKQAEETAAFEKIMREVSDATNKVNSSNRRAKVKAPEPEVVSTNTTEIGIDSLIPTQQSLGTFRSGSLPNVAAAQPPKQEAIKPEEVTLATQYGHGGRSGGASPTPRSPGQRGRASSSVGPMRRPADRKHDTSPYGSTVYLSPPPDSNWRRTNSDSALHQSCGEQQATTQPLSPHHPLHSHAHPHAHPHQNHRRAGNIHLDVLATLGMNPTNRPRSSCEIPRIPNNNKCLKSDKMAISLMRLGFRSALNLERSAAILSNTSVQNQIKSIHTRVSCNGKVCYIQTVQESRDLDLSEVANSLRRNYSKQHGRPEENRRKDYRDSDSDSDSDTECKGYDRSEFWRRKMRTVHNILDVDKDGLISYNDFLLFSERFKSLGHLDDKQAKEFTDIIKLTWEEQWGAIDPYNFVTVEQYLEDMHHVLNDKTLKKKAHRWLPYLFKAVDKDKSGFISVKEFKLFFKCLGLSNEHAAVAFAVIDTNGDGKLSLKEFVKLGRDFLCTEDECRVSKMFWGPLIDV